MEVPELQVVGGGVDGTRTRGLRRDSHKIHSAKTRILNHLQRVPRSGATLLHHVLVRRIIRSALEELARISGDSVYARRWIGVGVHIGCSETAASQRLNVRSLHLRTVEIGFNPHTLAPYTRRPEGGLLESLTLRCV